jgi:hypothetical protein
MDEELDCYFTNSSNYLESLINSYVAVSKLQTGMALTKKLQEVIEIEIELALIGAKKARGEILKEEAKNNVVQLKKPEA